MAPPIRAGSDARVMARGEALAAELSDNVTQERVELDVLVARDAGVGRPARGVGVDEGSDDALAEDVRVVERVKRDAQNRRRPAGVLTRLVGAATAWRVGIAPRAHQAHPYPDHVLAALGQDRGRDG